MGDGDWRWHWHPRDRRHGALGNSGRADRPDQCRQHIVSGGPTADGTLVKATTAVWEDIVRKLGNDWSVAIGFSSRQWEAIVAGAFNRLGFEKVTLTPQSGDHGRDVIAVSGGFCSQKIIVSVKANKASRLVPYDDIRALVGVMAGERDDERYNNYDVGFPPNIDKDPFIAPFLPTRLELINKDKLPLFLSQSLSANS